MRKTILIIFYFLSLPLWAQEIPPSKNQLTLSGALDSNDAWEVEFSYMRRLNSWLGAGAGVSIYQQYACNINPDVPKLPGQGIPQWILSDQSQHMSGVQFNPYLHLNTPTLFTIQDLGVVLYAEPGLLLTLADRNIAADYWYGNGYYDRRTFSGHSGDRLFWSCRSGLSLEGEKGCFSIGYFASNTDMYTNIRSIHIDNVDLGKYLPKKHFNWGIFISLGYKF